MALSFFFLVIVCNVVIWYVGRKEYLAFLDIFTSWVIAGLMHLTGLHAVRDSNTIYLPNSVWIVSVECTAIYIMVIFAAFVVVYPASRRSRGYAVLLGIPFIFCANIVRLYIMAWIDRLKPEFSEYFHNYMWQGVFIVMVIFMWMIWIEWMAGTASPPEARVKTAKG